ncbi:MAG: hypothetical protein IKN32_03000 [Bacteroidales bacterium]|nr:hypothetical protein [Bacteroidales bacterium]
MANQTTEFKRTVSGTINSGMRSVFGGKADATSSSSTKTIRRYTVVASNRR